jgi:hypothetical protein
MRNTKRRLAENLPKGSVFAIAFIECYIIFRMIVFPESGAPYRVGDA